MTKDSEPESKTYSLTQADSQMLGYVRRHLDTVFSGVLSNIAATKFAYPVSQHTQFNLKGDFSEITITELEPKSPVPEAPDAKSDNAIRPSTK